MTKQDISEIKKLFTPRNCSITRICGCYVDGEKNKKAELKQAFLALPEEEMFKYFEILRKVLSGTLGKNLLTLDFPLALEMAGMTAPEKGSSKISPDAAAEGGPLSDTSESDGSLSDTAVTDSSLPDTAATDDSLPDTAESGSILPHAALPDAAGPDAPSNTHEFLMRLKDSKLKDEALLEEYYDRIIENYEYVGNYLILIVHDVYDVPGRTTDGIDMDDASDEIYEYILSCICPVELSKPGLSYDAEENTFHNRNRDWVVSLPETGFLFPAFNDRGTDIHSVLYYSKNPEELREAFVEQLLGCPLPMSAESQKETFQSLIEDTLGEDCGIEMVKNIHDRFTELAEEHKEAPEPVVLDKNEVKTILADSGVANEKLSEFDRHYDETAGENASLLMSNVMNTRSFEVKTPDVVIKVSPDRTDLIETRTIDGRECLVIALDGSILVNGIAVRTVSENEEDEE
ncbi:MAG: DUF4317 domain-containing protein [Lachnospiraceae bacterium]|nr:DUF4317 domain-containing protein [Lachnospiraceae bacterium]